MSHYDVAGCELDGSPEDLSWMNQAGIDSADADQVRDDGPVSGIEENDVEVFFVSIELV